MSGELEQREALERDLQDRLAEAGPREIAAISKEIRAVWAEIEAIKADAQGEEPDDLAERRRRIEAANGRTSAATA